jgi:hypothetical protein
MTMALKTDNNNSNSEDRSSENNTHDVKFKMVRLKTVGVWHIQRKTYKKR